MMLVSRDSFSKLDNKKEVDVERKNGLSVVSRVVSRVVGRVVRKWVEIDETESSSAAQPAKGAVQVSQV